MTVIVRYSEIFLKSHGTRRTWIEILCKNISSALGTGFSVTPRRGRIIIEGEFDKIKAVLERTFGVHSFSPIEQVSSDLQSMQQKAMDLVHEGTTFAIKVKRSWKGFPLTSVQLAAKIGEAVINKQGNKVDIKHPEEEVTFEVHEDTTFVFTETFEGPGGVPLGTGSRVLLLYDSDFSEAAGWLMMKRGSPVDVLGPRLKNLEQWGIGFRVGYTKGDIKTVAKKYPAVVSGVLSYKKMKREGYTLFYPLVGLPKETLSKIQQKALA